MWKTLQKNNLSRSNIICSSTSNRKYTPNKKEKQDNNNSIKRLLKNNGKARVIKHQQKKTDTTIINQYQMSSGQESFMQSINQYTETSKPAYINKTRMTSPCLKTTKNTRLKDHYQQQTSIGSTSNKTKHKKTNSVAFSSRMAKLKKQLQYESHITQRVEQRMNITRCAIKNISQNYLSQMKQLQQQKTRILSSRKYLQ